MSDKTETTWNALAARVLGWIAPVLLGAAITLLLTFAGTNRQVDVNTESISQLQKSVQNLEQNYATNKRVDDLTAEVRSNYRDLKGGNDEILRLLIQMQQGRR